MQTNVLLVDDHTLFRKGLRLLLEEEADLCVVGEAEDGQAAIKLVRELSPNVVVMDISMPDMDGIQATRNILADKPDTKIIALSIHSKKDFVQEMLLAGAAGYILKQSAPEEVVSGIRAVQEGETFLSATITELVVSDYKNILLDEPVAEDQDADTHYLPILTTKLLRPRISETTVSRIRLFEMLSARTLKSLTLVSAPAGYGKSTLVSQWLEVIKSDFPGVWLSLDENDNDFRTFLTYLVAAVHTQFPDALQEISQLLKASNLPSHQFVAHTLVNELERVPQPFILVLDDYQYIEEPAIHDLLAEFLRHPSQTTHLVLATRTDPPLDLLNLHAQQKIIEVRADALNFTFKETGAYLKTIVGSEVDEGIAKSMTEKTEGWITGLRLITLTLEDSNDLTDISVTIPGEQQTLDYLVAEALSRQPQEIQAWLLKTSILDRFCASLCEAVCSNSGEREAGILSGNSFIQWLMQNNLFVAQLDERGQWFRYHHLFQELLQNQLENALEADEIAALHKLASTWHVENNLIDQGIKHAINSGDFILAAEIIESNRFSKLVRDQWFLLKRWLSMLPEAIKQQRVELLLAEVEVYLVEHNLPALLSNMDRIEQIAGSQETSKLVLGEVNYYKGYLAYFQGQGPLAYEHQLQAIDMLPESNYYRSEAELHYALSLHMTGKKERAIQQLNDWLDPGRNLAATHYIRLWGGLSFIHLLEGELNEVTYPAEKLQTIASQINDTYTEGYILYIQSCAHLAQNDQEATAQKLAWIADNQYMLQTRLVVDSYCGLALLYQLQNQPDKVKETTRQMLEFVREKNDTANILIASSCQAHLSLMNGDIPAAVRWLRTADLDMDTGIMLWWIELPRITACRVQIAEGSHDNLQEAIDQLEVYLKENKAVHNTYQEIVMLPLLALAYHKQKQDDKALANLEEALRLGYPGGWIWPFTELGSQMADMLRRLRLQGVARETERYIDQILAAFPSAEIPGEQPGLLDRLTEREMEVLQLLATALGTEEIAAQLVVSVKTLRTHTRNIYSKLDVHSRIEAVQRARELGLIKVSNNE